MKPATALQRLPHLYGRLVHLYGRLVLELAASQSPAQPGPDTEALAEETIQRIRERQAEEDARREATEVKP